VGGRLTDGDSYAGGSLRVMGNLRDRTCGWCSGGALCAITRNEYILVQKELVRQNAHIKLDHNPRWRTNMRVVQTAVWSFHLDEAVSIPNRALEPSPEGQFPNGQ